MTSCYAHAYISYISHIYICSGRIIGQSGYQSLSSGFTIDNSTINFVNRLGVEYWFKRFRFRPGVIKDSEDSDEFSDPSLIKYDIRLFGLTVGSDNFKLPELNITLIENPMDCYHPSDGTYIRTCIHISLLSLSLSLSLLGFCCS